MTYTLRPYQQHAREFLVAHPRSMLHIEMSLGKTAVVLHAIKDLFSLGKVYGVLVVAPKMVCDQVWAQEAHSPQWPALNDIQITKCLGKPEQRLARVTSNAHVKVINYENLLWLIPWVRHYYIDRGKRPPFNLIVFDEVRRLANLDTKRFKALAQIIQYFNYRIGMTGTPATRGLTDLFGQYLMIDDGRCLGSSVTSFRRTYFQTSDFNQYALQVIPGLEASIYRKIAPITFSLKGEDYLQLPRMMTYDIYLDLPAKIMKMYNKFERDLLVELTNGTVIESPTAASAKMKCRQIANGAVYPNPEDHSRWERVHDIKLDIAEEIASEANGEPMLVCYEFLSDRARLVKRLTKYGFVAAGSGVSRKENSRILGLWNQEMLPGIITHANSLGHGLNLQFGGHRVVWYGLTWSLDQYEQMIHRLRRPHQKSDRIIIQRILMKDTVDVAMDLRLQSNDQTQRGLWNAMRTYMSKKYGITLMRNAS